MDSRALVPVSFGCKAKTRCATLGLIALCSLTSALAQAQPAETRNAEFTGVAGASMGAEEQRRFVERFIQEKLETWRKHLSLKDWKVSVVMARRDALKAKTLGGIRWDKGKKSAVISVLDVSEYRLPFREMLDDLEFTLVHELVHLELASLPRSQASRRKEEHAVNRLTEALLKLSREQ